MWSPDQGSFGFLSKPVASSQALMKSSSMGRRQSLNEVLAGPEVPWYSPTKGIVERSVTQSSMGSRVWCLRMYGIKASAFQPSSPAMMAQSS